MRKKILAVIIVILIMGGIGIISILIKQNKVHSVDYSGNNGMYRVTFNVAKYGQTELRVVPRRDDFNIPSQIEVGIQELSGKIHNEILEYSTDKDLFIMRYPTYKPFKTNIEELTFTLKWEGGNGQVIVTKNKYN